MVKNEGKIFEEDFRKSIDETWYVYRLKDSAQSFVKSKGTKFSWDNPCDFFLYNKDSGVMYAIELKSTKYKSIAYETSENCEKRMIKFNQIKGLNDAANYGVISGFLFNFRNDVDKTSRTYFQKIEDFNIMTMNNGKVSLNEIDLLLNNAIKVEGIKKRTHYRWNICPVLENLGGIKYEEECLC